MSPLAHRVHGEYREMPGLRLTVRQAARLFSVAPDLADAVLHELQRASILMRSHDGAFALVCEPSHATADASQHASVSGQWFVGASERRFRRASDDQERAMVTSDIATILTGERM